MMEGKSFKKYLGFPIFTSKPTRRDFQFISDNFKNRLAGWKTNHLTMAGRTTLIKAILNTIPNHIIQIMSLTTHLISRLESYQKNLLWFSTYQKRWLHLINWNIVTIPKEQEGLAIQRLRNNNDALLPGKAWRLFHQPHTPWASFLISKYITNPKQPFQRTSIL